MPSRGLPLFGTICPRYGATAGATGRRSRSPHGMARAPRFGSRRADSGEPFAAGGQRAADWQRRVGDLQFPYPGRDGHRAAADHFGRGSGARAHAGGRATRAGVSRRRAATEPDHARTPQPARADAAGHRGGAAAHAGARLRTATGRQRPRRRPRRHRRRRRAAARRACERPAPDPPAHPAQLLPDRRGLQPATGLGDRRSDSAQL
jgi:hypothetical protein